MGVVESKAGQSENQVGVDDEITRVTENVEAIDPLLQRLTSLKIAYPIIKEPRPSASESSLTDILLTKHLPTSSSPSSGDSSSGKLNPEVLFELFEAYCNWQDDKAKRITERQEEVENKIEVADALAAKLMQRFNYSLSTMKRASQHLSNVHQLQVEVGTLKGRITEVVSNCDALCKRIELEGPESLRASIRSSSLSSSLLQQISHSSSDGTSIEPSTQ